MNAWSKPTTASSRAFSVSTARKSGHASPQLLGEGGKAGEVPTDINQSTGLERLQTLGFLEGVEVFDTQPLDSSRIGTLDNPVLVYSLVSVFLFFPCCFVGYTLGLGADVGCFKDVERVMGCTGSPADSHDIRWYTIHKDKLLRCGECGSGKSPRHCSNLRDCWIT